MIGAPERRLLGLLRPHTGLILLGLGATTLASLLDGVTVVLLSPLLEHLFGTSVQVGATPTQLKQFLDGALAPLLGDATGGAAAARIVGLLVVGLLVKNAMTVVSDQLTTAVQEGLVRDLRVRLYRHLLRVDLGFFERTRSGQLIASMVVDVDQAKAVVPAVQASVLRNLVVILVTLAILAGISWRLTVVTLATAPVLVFGIQLLLKRLKRHAREWADARADLTATVTERFGAIKLIRAVGSEEREAEHFTRQADAYRKRVIRTQRFSVMTSPVSEVFGGLVIILVIWASTFPALTGGALSADMTIVFLIAALRIMSPLKSLSQAPSQLATAMTGAERVFALLDHPLDDVDRPGEGRATFTDRITFDRVAARYGDGPLVLEDVSFEVPKGTVVAIVGPSGAGKTTLLELLPRFQDPAAGEIRLDGVPLTRLTRGSLRALMSVVGQDTIVLNDTIRANIAYGRPEATPAEVEAAARAANAHEFVAAMPAGYETVLGERGARLSGGQRQRIAIARALLRDPPLLILDEATSALDTESEQLVQQAIDRLMTNRTVLVIAHRLATVRHADRIVVLDRGRVVETGTHEALLARNGLYRRLHDLQFAADPGPVPA